MSGFVAQPVFVSSDTPAPVESVRGRRGSGQHRAGGSAALAVAATALLVILVVPDPMARLVAMVAVVVAAAAVVLAIRRTRAIDREAAAHSEETDRARQAVLISEQRYAALAESIPQLVWVARSDGGLLDANVRWAEYTGVEWEDSLGLTWKDVVHPDDLAAALAGWADATRSGAAYAAEVRLRRVRRDIPLAHQPGRARPGFRRAGPFGGTGRAPTSRTASAPRPHSGTARRCFRRSSPTSRAACSGRTANSVYLGCNDQVARDCGLSSPRNWSARPTTTCRPPDPGRGLPGLRPAR